MTDEITAALAEFSSLIEADGGQVDLVCVGDSEVEVRLILEDAECIECVMPKQFLETIAVDIFKKHNSAISTVVVDDPRE